MFFKKKIIVTEEMKQTLQSFDEISWASCCGIPYKKESYYPYIQETSQASVEKILKHTMNYSDTVCLVNLFKEGLLCQSEGTDKLRKMRQSALRAIYKRSHSFG